MDSTTPITHLRPVEHPEFRDLPPSGWPRLRTLLIRALRRQCPLCGSPGIFDNWLTMKEYCPRCGYEFNREHGYFLGAYPLNLIAAEIIPVTLLIVLLIFTNLSWIWLEVILIPLAVGLPFLLYPYARMIWMVIDLFFQPVNQR